MSFTKIISNGSKWNGDEPDSIEVLLDRLAKHDLDPLFDEYVGAARHAVAVREDGVTRYEDGGPMYPESPDAVRFFGNFAELSAVFTIDTDDPEMIATLSHAIDANVRRRDCIPDSRIENAA